MKTLFSLIQKSAQSKKNLWLLNRLMNHQVRFNKPHKFQVIKISENQVQTFAPYHKKNFNHVRGIHACALATAGELSAGLSLMYHFSPEKYRVILANLTIDYHYQAKKDVTATTKFSVVEKEAIAKTLEEQKKTMHTLVTEVKDSDHQLVATVKSTWQIKAWRDVNTKL
ncbi:MAG: hypothetical protein A3F11_01265 [Gammaproteobacteria bacterium RIFCSPHIGHO2_12_FULL_37_14]|nr:MAG: hypothetical protein A3F11_01265 [Gammaproteobacteria bacterium RIFCSPHIGHO2_12_FULL_37_14]